MNGIQENEPLDDEKMGACLSQNFVEYCMQMDIKNYLKGEERKKIEEKKPNLELYQRLKKRNGK